jgi:hypothetical protein
MHLIGKIPPITDIGGDHANIFLYIVKYSGNYTLQNSSEVYDEYEIREWYPLYPIKRDTILPSWTYPKGYYSICDNIK